MVVYRLTILLILIRAIYNLWCVEDQRTQHSGEVLRKNMWAFVLHVVLFTVQLIFEVLQIYYFMQIFLSESISHNYDAFAMCVGILHVVSLTINHWLITSRIQQYQRYMKLTDKRRKRHMQEQHKSIN